MILSASTAFFAAAVLSLALTAAMIRMAPRLGLLDRPDGHRKLHKRPVALGGGLVVFLTMSIVLACVLLAPNGWNLHWSARWPEVVTFFAGFGGIVVVGLVDDRFGLRGRHKLLGQVAAAGALILGGLIIQKISLFGWTVELGLLAVPFTMFWLLGATNALNLLDGIDGLATVLGIILVATLGVMAALTGHTAVATVAIIFAGSLLGFLRYNLPPARIFLGDAGSMLIGLMVGALAIRSSLKGHGTLLLAAPLVVLTLPVLDSMAAILRRKLTGRSIYETDRGHLHHRLMQALGNNVRVLLVVAGACIFTSLAAIASLWYGNDILALLAALALVSIFVLTGLFGRAEFDLLFGHLRTSCVSLVRRKSGSRARASAMRMQGTCDWGLLWSTLTESAEKLHLLKIHLNVNMPKVQEGYNAMWEQRSGADPERCWRLELPLVIAGQPVGRLKIFGQLNGKPACEDIEQLLEWSAPAKRR